MTVSKTGVFIDDKEVKAALRTVRGLIKKPALMRELMQDIGTFWHHQIMPEHFTPGAETRYGYEKRTEGYLKGEKKRKGIGQGKWVANLLTGRTVRMMTHGATFTPTTRGVTIRMPAPRYFTRPYIGRITKADGTVVTIKRQPDKVREVTRVNAKDIQRMNQYGSARIKTICQRLLKMKAAA